MSEPVGPPQSFPTGDSIARQRRSIEGVLAAGNIDLYRRLADRLAHRSDELAAWVGVGMGSQGRVVALLDRNDLHVLGQLQQEFDPDWGHLDHRVIGGIVPAAAPGDSIGAGLTGGMSGTLGCLVTCNATGATMALTNDHVVGLLEGRAPGDDVWSPGSAMGGTTASSIGTFERGSAVVFGKTPNRSDAALVSLTAPSKHSSALPSGITPTRIASGIGLGDRGHKDGATTSYTSGDMVFIASLLVPYSSGTAMFVDQYVFDGATTPFAQLGDSGALVYSDQDDAIGLLFAAAPAANLGFVNPMGDVLNAVNASL